ncbi:hypothetical protein [Pelagibacterium montanilacus]|uniref:hypothetical protein n=1 Tax=Pelagibacterium montanilacus TaxID=2185280 RepID=UPI000F8D267B|nr:hypothetical protein [Pelagibacterium montanilacus]
MAKKDWQEQRLENTSTGEHLGGTHFGQTPGSKGTNPAKPDRQKPSPRDRSPAEPSDAEEGINSANDAIEEMIENDDKDRRRD